MSQGHLGRRRRVRLTVVIFLALLLVGAALLGAALYRLWTAVSAVRADLDAVESLAAGGVEGLDVAQATALWHTVRADVEALDRAARPFLWLAPHLGWLPRYGADIQAAPALLEIAVNLVTAGDEVVGPLSPLLEQATGSAPGQAGLMEEAVAALADARPQLLAAQSAVARARQARERLAVEGLSPRLRGWVERLDRYLPLLEQGVDAALLAPDLLGADGPRTYLVLVQNEDELRPTGGFISGVARLTVERGRILALQFEDSYAVDDFTRPYPDPPAALRETMRSDLWLFRDSNWSPDFPTSARQAIALYTISRDVEVDGVIALDQQAIWLLLDGLGPLEVEGYDEPVTGANVIQAARQAWNPGDDPTAEWWLHRKDFMAAVLEAALRRLNREAEQVDLRVLAQAALQALQQRHIQLYLEDAPAAALAAELGWDGALAEDDGDFLMVVDANVGFNKVNAVIEESLEYTVDLSDPTHPRATLIVRHRHTLTEGETPCRQEPRYDPTYEQMIARCYWDYLRVYLPAGSELLAATGHPIPGESLLDGQPRDGTVTLTRGESGRDVLATFLLLDVGETVETRFEIALPTEVVQAQDAGFVYRLTVQKQAGTGALPLRVRVRLPAGAQVVETQPAPSTVEGTVLEFALTLEMDRAVQVVFR